MKIVRNFLFLLLLVVPGVLLAGELVDINTATKEELMTLNGIGQAKAQAIINYRTLHGVTSFEIRGTLSHDQAWVPDGAHGRS